MTSPAGVATVVLDESLRVRSADGVEADLRLVLPARSGAQLLYWLPALGVAARNYAPFAHALAARGIGVALHEWRGAGSSNLRARRRIDWGYRDLLLTDIPAGLAAARHRFGAAGMMLGGHSLGGQLAVLSAALQPQEIAGLVLVASGSPWWPCFQRPRLVQAACIAVPAMAWACGRFPGRRLGFGGNEARGVMTDWARSGRSGRYRPAGMAQDLEMMLGRLDLPVRAWRLADDWLGPPASLDWLLDKMPNATRTVRVMDESALGIKADHFSWMRTPERLAASIIEE
jgi:predicted alpha/beta hydrolase